MLKIKMQLKPIATMYPMKGLHIYGLYNYNCIHITWFETNPYTPEFSVQIKTETQQKNEKVLVSVKTQFTLCHKNMVKTY